MEFKFATASRIFFGCGERHRLGGFASEFGERALLVTGSDPGRFGEVLFTLDNAHVVYETFRIVHEPTIEVILKGIDQAKTFGCELVIAIGGGSVMDGGKAIAALMVNEGNPLDYLEVIGKGEPLVHPSLPIIAVPTTAGTGSEVTRNAVLASQEHRVKVSLRSSTMLPRIALVDPEMTFGLPSDLTATTGMDALTQVLEPYVSKKSNPFVDILCKEGMRRAARSLEEVYENGHDLAAREDMAFTSLLGGMALANAKLGAVHGFAGPLGAMISGPHGAICARLLPYVMERNIRALVNRAPECPAIGRYQEISGILTGRESATMMDGVEWIMELCDKLEIPPLRDFGLKEEQFPEVIRKASRSSSMKGNPIILTEQELEEILIQAL
jgi:alcohol dehydrogenase class IV